MNAKCKKCVYRSDKIHLNACDYILITGKPRGCAGGKDCTKFQPGKRKKTGQEMTKEGRRLALSS